jgi:peptidoglycan/LPS O-acetylase OafA/YrhL
VTLAALPGTDLALVLLFPALVACLADERHWVAKVLGSRVPHRLGELSYSIYLIHMPVLWIGLNVRARVGDVPHADAIMALAVFASVLSLASVTYPFIERPAQRVVRRALASVPTGGRAPARAIPAHVIAALRGTPAPARTS